MLKLIVKIISQKLVRHLSYKLEPNNQAEVNKMLFLQGTMATVFFKFLIIDFLIFVIKTYYRKKFILYQCLYSKRFWFSMIMYVCFLIRWVEYT